MLKPEFLFLWLLFHVVAVELPQKLSNRGKVKLPATEHYAHQRYAEALKIYDSLGQVKNNAELKTVALALWKMNNVDSARKVYNHYFTKYPDKISSYDFVNMALITRELGEYRVSDSLIQVVRTGELGYSGIFEDNQDTDYVKREKKLTVNPATLKSWGIKNSEDVFGAVKNLSTGEWIIHTHDPIQSGLIDNISHGLNKPYGQIYKVGGWKDSNIQTNGIIANPKLNGFFEVSYIDSNNDMYVTMNNAFVSDSNQYLLNVYKYYYDPKVSSFKAQRINGFDRYYYNVSSISFNETKTKAVFSSDMPSGLGKSDIYTADVIWNTGNAPTLSNFRNMGNKVNTMLSETDPIFINDDIIAFSTEGRIGKGGRDIYFYSNTTNQVVNAGAVINSNYNEYLPKYYNGKLLYTSDRGGSGKSRIYSVELPYDLIFEALQPIEYIIPTPPEPEVVVVENKGDIKSTLDELRKENFNKYDYARSMSFIFMSDIERLNKIGLLDSTANYKDFKFMPLVHIDNNSVIEKEYENELKIIAALLLKKPEWGIEIRSYTDSRGNSKTNAKLSQSRANYVADFLKAQGVSMNQILPVGFGETMLLNHCTDGVPCSEEEHRQNRRTELIISPVLFWEKTKKNK